MDSFPTNQVIQIMILVASGVCYICILGSLWLCYRRTANRAFILLGAMMLFWPAFAFGLNSVVMAFADQAIKGDRPWLFPFSLMGGANPEMTVGQFLVTFAEARGLMEISLIAICLALLAKSFRQTAAHVTHS
jgi:hypothetical protein